MEKENLVRVDIHAPESRMPNGDYVAMVKSIHDLNPENTTNYIDYILIKSSGDAPEDEREYIHEQYDQPEDRERLKEAINAIVPEMPFEDYMKTEDKGDLCERKVLITVGGKPCEMGRKIVVESVRNINVDDSNDACKANSQENDDADAAMVTVSDNVEVGCEDNTQPDENKQVDQDSVLSNHEDEGEEVNEEKSDVCAEVGEVEDENVTDIDCPENKSESGIENDRQDSEEISDTDKEWWNKNCQVKTDAEQDTMLAWASKASTGYLPPEIEAHFISHVDHDNNLGETKHEVMDKDEDKPVRNANRIFGELKYLPVDELEVIPELSSLFKIDEEIQDKVSESISCDGYNIANPIAVWKPEERYIVVDGHTRLCAARMAGRISVPCVVHKFDDINNAKLYSILSQTKRRNLSDSELLEYVPIVNEMINNAYIPNRTSDGKFSPAGANEPSGRKDVTIAKELGTSPDKVKKTNRLAKSGDKKLIDEVRTENRSLNDAIDILKNREEASKSDEDYKLDVNWIVLDNMQKVMDYINDNQYGTTMPLIRNINQGSVKYIVFDKKVEGLPDFLMMNEKEADTWLKMRISGEVNISYDPGGTWKKDLFSNGRYPFRIVYVEYDYESYLKQNRVDVYMVVTGGKYRGMRTTCTFKYTDDSSDKRYQKLASFIQECGLSESVSVEDLKDEIFCNSFVGIELLAKKTTPLKNVDFEDWKVVAKSSDEEEEAEDGGSAADAIDDNEQSGSKKENEEDYEEYDYTDDDDDDDELEQMDRELDEDMDDADAA